MTPPQPLNADVLAQFNAQLQELITQNKGVKAALLATTDGFEVALAGNFGNSEPSSAAAMTSSMLSLAIAMVDQAALAGCQNLVVEAEQGRILIMSVPGKSDQMLLTVITENEVAFGQLLLEAKITVRQLSTILQAM